MAGGGSLFGRWGLPFWKGRRRRGGRVPPGGPLRAKAALLHCCSSVSGGSGANLASFRSLRPRSNSGSSANLRSGCSGSHSAGGWIGWRRREGRVDGGQGCGWRRHWGRRRLGIKMARLVADVDLIARWQRCAHPARTPRCSCPDSCSAHVARNRSARHTSPTCRISCVMRRRRRWRRWLRRRRRRWRRHPRSPTWRNLYSLR